jgi:hypothetical protein
VMTPGRKRYREHYIPPYARPSPPPPPGMEGPRLDEPGVGMRNDM